jgi:outer membrane receptor for ferrienterochelin and colicins
MRLAASIRRLRRCALVALGLVATSSIATAQDAGVIRGTVRSAEDRTPIRNMTVHVLGTGLSALTDNEGRFVLARVPAGQRTVAFRQFGYRPHEQSVSVQSGATVQMEVEIQLVPVTISEIVVTTASRAPERIVEAPAAVSVVDPALARDFAPTGQLPLALSTVPGVDIVQSGVNDFNVNARGLNSSLNRRVLVLQDGRDLAIAFLGAPQEWNAMAVPMDEASRIEMVRGPGSALYGANAFAGVLAITTPSPRETPGARVSLVGGELSSLRADVRYAGLLSGGRFGYRANFGYSTNQSWTRSRTASDSLDIVLEYLQATDRPVNRSREVRPLNGQTLSTFNIAAGDPDPLTSTYGSARLDWYGATGMVGTMEAGTARVENEVFVTGIGRVQVTKADRPWARFNVASQRFNVMAWYSGRESVEPQYSLGAGLPLNERSSIYHVEGQTNFALGGDRARMVVGGSYRNYRVNTDSSLMEAADDDRNDNYSSLFGQVEVRLMSNLRAVVAGRFDAGSLFESQFSPKAALIYAPHRDHSLRVTLNRAFQTPNYSEYFLRAPAGAPTGSPAFLEGNLEAYLAAVNGAVAGGALPASVTAGLNTGPLPWNFAALTPVQARGNRNLDVETVTGWEIGYKGNLSSRSFVTIDWYRSDMRNFVTDLLPGVNPDFPTYALDDDRNVGATLDSIQNRLAGLGLPAAHPLRANNTALRAGLNQLNAAAGPLLATMPDGSRALIVSYTNAGRVIAQGFEVGLSLAISPLFRFDGSVSWFDFEVREQQLGDRLLANTPRLKGSLGLSYADQRFDFNITGRFVGDMDWAAGIFTGYVPSAQTINLSAGWRLNNSVRLHGIATNFTDQRRYQLFGGSVIGRRVLAGITAEF